MREYAKVSPAFWTGDTGIKLRKAGPTTQLVALYLLTCRFANMIGLYHLPIPMLAYDLGMTGEGASKALRRVEEAGFAKYEPATDLVWIPEAARYQVGEALAATDNRVKGIVNALSPFRKSQYFQEFYEKYACIYNLPEPSPLPSPLEGGVGAPSKPGAGTGAGTGDTLARPKPKKSGDAEGFEDFWLTYPKKVGKVDAQKAWNKLCPDETARAKIAAAIGRQGKSEDWLRDSGKFIPHPATWLNGHRWEDEGVMAFPASQPKLFDADETKHRMQQLKEGR